MNPEELYRLHEHLAKETLFRMYPDPKGIAKKYGLDFEDLLQYAKTGLWIAAKSYDSSKSKFITHGINNIRWHLKERLNRECCIFKINPNNHDWDNMYEVVSMDAEMKDNFGRTYTEHDVVASDNNVEIDAISDIEYKHIIDKLTDKQKEILHMREKEMPLHKIGTEMNLSKERVRQLLIDIAKNGLLGEKYKNKVPKYMIHENFKNKKVCINGTIYKSIKEAGIELNLKSNVIVGRLKSKTKRFENWQYVS